MDFQNFSKLNFANLPWGQARSHKKCGPNRFIGFEQTDKHPEKNSIKIDKVVIWIKSFVCPIINFLNGELGRPKGIFLAWFSDSKLSGSIFNGKNIQNRNLRQGESKW